MPKHVKDIDTIVTLLKKEVEGYETPMSTEIADETNSPFAVLISCIMSLRTKDTTTLPAARRLFKIADNAHDMAKLSLKTIEKAIYPVGFYITKAKYIKDTCKILVEEYDGKVPDTMEELLTLPGIGKKCGAITMVYGHKIPEYIAVDVHVQVISFRLGWVKTTNPDKTMDELMKIVPRKYWYDLNEVFVQHGQKTCITISPICSQCAIEKYCPKVGVEKSR